MIINDTDESIYPTMRLFTPSAIIPDTPNCGGLATYSVNKYKIPEVNISIWSNLQHNLQKWMHHDDKKKNLISLNCIFGIFLNYYQICFEKRWYHYNTIIVCIIILPRITVWNMEKSVLKVPDTGVPVSGP